MEDLPLLVNFRLPTTIVHNSSLTTIIKGCQTSITTICQNKVFMLTQKVIFTLGSKDLYLILHVNMLNIAAWAIIVFIAQSLVSQLQRTVQTRVKEKN
jgi:hypothetical protein